MAHESKHEIQMSAEQRIATSISALLASTDCLHPELPVTDETEWNYLTQLGEALAKDEFDDAAYGQLFTRLEADNLSLAALYRFANLCYQHWQRQWLSASVLQTNQAEIAQQTAQLQAMAQGRTLFRRPGTPTRYYWGQTNASANNTAEKGLFFACYPTFAAQGESIKAIYQAELITDVAHIALCEAHTQAQRRQQSFNQLLQHSSLLHQRLQQHSHHAKIVVNLQLAWLYYRSGQIVSSLSIHETGQAVFYFRQAMGQIARHTFIQQQPALPAALITAAEHVRERIDQAMLDHVQQTLFAAQSATLITRWQQCYQDAQLEAIYQLSQQTHALLTHAVSVPLAAKQSLIDAWLAGFNRGLAGEDEQEVRVAMQSAVTRACNPVQKYPHSLATVHQWLLTLARQLQQRGENGRARALLHAYQQLLIRRRPNLQSTIANTDQDKAPYIATLATCEQALTELDQWLAASNHQPPDVPRLVRGIQEKPGPREQAAERSDGVAGRNNSKEALQKWRQTLTTALATGAAAQRIYADNTEFARNLLAGICREIEQQIGPAPCAYTLLGAGSFSRGEISPASDLDCALLVADASVKTVDEDNSNKVTFHPWFQCFLQLLQWKLASLPKGVLELDSKTMTWIIKGSWLDTSEGFIQQHLASQQPHNSGSLQEADNFGAQWFRWIYSNQSQSQEQDALFDKYQRDLRDFFHTSIDTSPLPAYQQLAPWSLAKHIGEPVEPHYQQLSFSPTSASENPIESKKSKHEVKASLSESSTKTTFTVLNVKRLSYRLINSILCYGRFNDVPSGISTTHEVLAYLKDRQCLPSSFITRLETALDQLYSWRLRQHWAWLHHASELGENEVILWPEDAAQQATIQALPSEWRGFYLNKAESEQCQTILNTIAEVVGRSVEGFTNFAAQQPVTAVLPAEHSATLAPSPLSSSSTTTTSETKEVKETKHEVSEEEAKAIVAAQSRPVTEAKAPTPPPAVQTFNPLPAAVEWTLHQLVEGSLSQAEQAKHVSWLAHVMGTCAAELSESVSRPYEPTHVKQDPLFRRHWQVYWAIPTTWHMLYIQQLRQSPDIDTAAIIEPLCHAPDPSGRRLHWREEQAQWQQHRLPQLWENKPIATNATSPAISIVQQVLVGNEKQWRVETHPLKPAISKQLFLANGDWHPKDLRVLGNHRVYPIKIGSQVCFWVKVYPEQPASEFLVTELDRRLGVWGTPQMELVKFHHGGKTSAALITEAVYGLNLRDTISNAPQQLAKLAFTSFIRTLWRVLLTNPEDDKGDDYFLVPQSDGSNHLVRIDNERAFFKPSIASQGLLFQSEHLAVKSIIYCLEQMQWAWAQDTIVTAVVEDFLSLQPVALISDLLQTADQLHDGWNQLFSLGEVTAHLGCKDPWTSLPVMCIPNGLARELITRLTTLHTALRMDYRHMTGLQLLKITQPKLAQYYIAGYQSPVSKARPAVQIEYKTLSPTSVSPQRAHTTSVARDDVDHRHVNARFERIAGHLYQKKDAKGPHSTQRSSMPNSVAMQSSLRLESPIDLATLQKVRNKEVCSAKQQLAEFAQWQKSQRLRLLTDLLAQKPTAMAEWQSLPLRQQHLLFTQLQTIAQTKPLSSEQQRFVLRALAAVVSETAWPQLNFKGFETVLTDALLEPLLRGTGQQLLQLNLNDCSQLTDKSFQIILASNPNLRQLSAQRINWTNFSLTTLPHLEQLDLSSSTTQTLVGEAPSLRSLQLKDCQQLQNLGEIGWLQDNFFSAPRLTQVNLGGCLRLTHLCLPKELFFTTVASRLPQTLKTITLQTETGWLRVPDFLIKFLCNKVTKLDFSKDKRLTSIQLKQLISYLVHDRFFTDLGLAGNRLGDEGAQALAEALKTNTRLTTLNLSNNSLSSAGAQALAEALKTSTRLTRLTLGSNSLSNAGAQALAEVLKTNTRLATLNLWGIQLGDAGAQTLAEALKTNTTLTTLDLRGNQLGDAGMQALAEALKTNFTLVTLNLEGNQLSDIGAQALAQAFKTNSTLTTLGVNSKLSGVGAQALAEALKSNTTLTTLGHAALQELAAAETLTSFYATAIDLPSIRHWGFSEDQLLDLREPLGIVIACLIRNRLRNSTFRRLNLNRRWLGDASVQILAEALKTNTTLTTLDLRGNWLHDTSAQALAEALKINTTLAELDLRDNSLSKTGIQILSDACRARTTFPFLLFDNNSGLDDIDKQVVRALENNNTLSRLDLSHKQFNDRDVQKLIDTLKTNTTLTSLNLSWSKLSETELQTVVEALKTNTTLTSLNLSWSKLSGTELQTIVEMLKTNTSLIVLDLGGNRLDGARAQALAEVLRTNTTLTILDLSGNQLSDAGVHALAEALHVNTTLTTLHLDSNKLGEAGKAAKDKIEGYLARNRGLQKITKPASQPQDNRSTSFPLLLESKGTKDTFKAPTPSGITNPMPENLSTVDPAPNLDNLTASVQITAGPLLPSPHERKVEVGATNTPLFPQSSTGLQAPYARFLPPLFPADEKTQTLLQEIRDALDRAYPPRMDEHSDMRRAYLTQLSEYESRPGRLDKKERDALRQLLTTLEEVVTQRDAVQSPATSTTTMQSQ